MGGWGSKGRSAAISPRRRLSGVKRRPSAILPEAVRKYWARFITTPSLGRFSMWRGPVRRAAVSGGMVKIEKNDVLVLVDSVERPEEIDAARARREADEAREAMLQKKSRQEYQLAQAALARAMNRLRVKAAEIK